jgi:hypothetical protein
MFNVMYAFYLLLQHKELHALFIWVMDLIKGPQLGSHIQLFDLFPFQVHP